MNLEKMQIVAQDIYSMYAGGEATKLTTLIRYGCGITTGITYLLI